MASDAPMSDETRVSSTKGSWIVEFEAPTRRMIPVSRRRENAVWRIVVAMSRMAQSTIRADSAIAPSVLVADVTTNPPAVSATSTAAFAPVVEAEVRVAIDQADLVALPATLAEHPLVVGLGLDGTDSGQQALANQLAYLLPFSLEQKLALLALPQPTEQLALIQSLLDRLQGEMLA